MSEVSTDKKLKGKDLITIGIFSAIYFVINFAFMLLGGIHPVLWMLMPGFIAVFAGIPFMLMVAKVQKLGAVFLMGLITALIYFVTGQFTLVILISMASTCILAEVVRAVTKYNSFKGNSIAYVIFSLGMVGSPLPIWLFKADFLAQITEQGMPADYVAAVEALSSNAMLIVLFVAPIIGGMHTVFWQSSDESVVIVDGSGRLPPSAWAKRRWRPIFAMRLANRVLAARTLAR